MATQPYAQQQYRTVPPGGNPRETESWALTEAARRMRLAQREDGNTEALLHAVRLNWRLWTIFQADISSPECALPTEVRQNMLNLCNFVDKVSVDVIADPQPQKLDILISINREIAAGLSVTPSDNGNGEAPGTPAPSAEAPKLDYSA